MDKGCLFLRKSIGEGTGFCPINFRIGENDGGNCCIEIGEVSK